MAESNTPENNTETLSKIQSYFRENSKSLTIIGSAIVVLVGGYFLYNKFIVQKNEKKAIEQLWKAEYYFEKDSFQLAVDGKMMYAGFKKIAKNFSGTSGGNIASYCLGISYLNLGKYKEAIEALEECEFDDDIVSSIAIGAQGDAYRELKKIDEAIEKYEEAADNRGGNQFTTPLYLKKAALAYEEKKNWKKAAELYQRIYDNYEHTTEGQDIEKYLAHARNLAK
ncbi:MAG TPA: tetratricopeptide repeat protein [Flavobacteriales bacterium]|nr:tetratricopeptide repeat protein [Flavobacteriales bacterium]